MVLLLQTFSNIVHNDKASPSGRHLTANPTHSSNTCLQCWPNTHFMLKGSYRSFPVLLDCFGGQLGFSRKSFEWSCLLQVLFLLPVYCWLFRFLCMLFGFMCLQMRASSFKCLLVCLLFQALQVVFEPMIAGKIVVWTLLTLLPVAVCFVEQEHSYLPVILTFCRHCGEDLAGILPRKQRYVVLGLRIATRRYANLWLVFDDWLPASTP